jgi:hypothetical protein
MAQISRDPSIGVSSTHSDVTLDSEEIGQHGTFRKLSPASFSRCFHTIVRHTREVRRSV